MTKLEDEVSTARKKIFRDGYDMSLGEIASLYERKELVINPEYQRLFRWDSEKKTRFIESVLLNIPFPPIFVFADKNGRWELVDGLQRTSTILELMGLLKGQDGKRKERFVCEETSLLPSLDGAFWPSDDEDSEIAGALPLSAQMTIRRARIRVEILGQETDAVVKYELFQRLNTGGANLSEQEIRNVIVISLNKDAFDSIKRMASNKYFLEITPVGEDRAEKQYHAELVTRFVVLRNRPYQKGMDVHAYLDQGIISIAQDNSFDWNAEEKIFSETMLKLHATLGGEAFRKNARFSLGMFEFVTLGLSKRLESSQVSDQEIADRVNAVEHLPEAKRFSGIGIRGTQRLAQFVVPLAEKHFA